MLFFPQIFNTILFFILAFSALSITSGCATVKNEWNANYKSNTLSERIKKKIPKEKISQEKIFIRTIDAEKEIFNTIADGYIPLGSSAFISTYCPLAKAVDCAESIGADLILASIEYIGESSSTVLLPQAQTTYTTTSGNTYATASAYGDGNRVNAYGSGYYSQSSASTTWTSAPVTIKEPLFYHQALFFRKGNFNNFYGAFLDIPAKLPDEKANSPISVKILEVLKNSKAEKDGLSRGMKVLSVNGKRIKTREDIEKIDLDRIEFIETEKTEETKK